jgi:hypothetical protein
MTRAISLFRQFFAARSIIEVSLRPLKLTEQAQLSLGKADWQEPRGYCRTKRDAAGLAGSLSGRKSRNC